jgi:hypothetical protein
MGSSYVSEPIVPLGTSFDTAGMARGEPGLPHKFRWREREFVVAEVLARGKGHGDCRNGSGERYVRRHRYRVRTTDGTIMNLYFQRSTGRGRLPAARWRIQSVESAGMPLPQAN